MYDAGREEKPRELAGRAQTGPHQVPRGPCGGAGWTSAEMTIREGVEPLGARHTDSVGQNGHAQRSLSAW